MIDAENILISVEERHAISMLVGRKTVELRRKRPNLRSETRVWVYSKLPKGQIQLHATVSKVVTETPEKLWLLYSDACAISKDEFDAYFSEAPLASAIVLKNIVPLAPILDLTAIRARVEGFQPPQFFKRLPNGSPELGFFKSALASCVDFH